MRITGSCNSRGFAAHTCVRFALAEWSAEQLIHELSAHVADDDFSTARIGTAPSNSTSQGAASVGVSISQRS